jgi:hypothetical protein
VSHRRAGIAALAAVFVLAGAAVAAAGGVSPFKEALLGGGSIEASFRQGFHPKLAWINLAVGKDGRTVTAYGDWNASCKGLAPPARASFTTKPFTLRPDGTFTVVGDLAASNTAGHYALTGRFTSATSAAGSGQSQFTFAADDGKRYDCDTGNVKWQARDDVHAGAGGKAAPKAGAVYYGNTHGPNGRLPLVLRVGRSGRTLEEAAGLVDARCTKDPSYYVHADPIFARVKIRPDGSFTSSPSYTDSLVGKQQGQEGRVTMTVKGKFGKTTVSGTWRVDVKIVVSGSGAPVDSCSSGLLTFKAVR